MLKRLIRSIEYRFKRASQPLRKAELSATQDLFVQWNAERLGISWEQSFQRYQQSWNAFAFGGHAGTTFRKFNDLSYDAYSTFYSDEPGEVFSAYNFFGHMHFLRMLSYDDIEYSIESDLYSHLDVLESITILDFGCGLAQRSRGFARMLAANSIRVKLLCSDIPTIRAEFLEYACKNENFQFEFLGCTKSTPIPTLEALNVVFALEFFEHVYEPEKYFDAFSEVLEPGGLLVTNVRNHDAEFMHVSPKLDELRTRIIQAGYDELIPYELYKKQFDTKPVHGAG